MEDRAGQGRSVLSLREEGEQYEACQRCWITASKFHKVRNVSNSFRGVELMWDVMVVSAMDLRLSPSSWRKQWEEGRHRPKWTRREECIFNNTSRHENDLACR